MSGLLPQFGHHSLRDGSKVPRLGYTEEARKLQQERKSNPPLKTTCLPPGMVWQKAIEAVTKLGGDINNELHVLGQHEVQFGVFSGQTFVWLLSNVLGYAGFIVEKIVNVEKEKESETPLSKNKFLLKRDMEKFEQGRPRPLPLPGVPP